MKRFGICRGRKGHPLKCHSRMLKLAPVRLKQGAVSMRFCACHSSESWNPEKHITGSQLQTRWDDNLRQQLQHQDAIQPRCLPRFAFRDVLLRIISSVIVLFSIVLCGFDAHSFVDPSSGMEIPELGSEWTREFGFGRNIVRYRSIAGGELIVRWADGGAGALQSAVADEYGGARILPNKQNVDDRDMSVIMFEVGGAFGMAVTRPVPVGSKHVEVLCVSPDGSRLEMMLACKRVASGIGNVETAGRVALGELEIPNPDSLRRMRIIYDANPSNVNLAVKLVLARYLFAVFDGRYGCEFVAKELLRISDRVLKNGDDVLAEDLSKLARSVDGKTHPAFDDISWFAGQSVKRILYAVGMEKSGRLNSARSIYEELIQNGYRYFAVLRLAKLDLEAGDYQSAEEYLPRVADDDNVSSEFVRALKLWMMRIGGGDLSKSEMKLHSEVCGESGAIHARQLGLLAMKSNPRKSIQCFTQAIKADPSYIPAYISLGQALIEGGGGTRVSMGELKRLLARAPRTTEIKRLDVRLNAWRPNVERGRHE